MLLEAYSLLISLGSCFTLGFADTVPKESEYDGVPADAWIKQFLNSKDEMERKKDVSCRDMSNFILKVAHFLLGSS